MTRKTKVDKALVVAHYFMSKSKAINRPLPNQKLQKLLYYAQAWSFVLNNKRLFNYKFEAWIHGAAIPVLYRRYRDFGANNIVEEYDESEFALLTDKERELLDEIWDVYGPYDAQYLEILNHNENPWQKARHDLLPYDLATVEISETEMKRYYTEKLRNAKRIPAGQAQ